MKHIIKIFVIIIVLGLCGTMAACSSTAADTKNDQAHTETAAEDNKEEEKPEEAEAEVNDTVETANIGIIASSLDRAVTNEFVNAVQTTLSEQYSDQIGEVFVMDAHGERVMLFEQLHNCCAMWDGGNNVILLVNDEENGFSDEDFLTLFEDTEGLKLTLGIDHNIDGSPENVFVYDKSDAAGCASLIMENALK